MTDQTTYTHDPQGLVFIRSLHQQTNTIHYRALALEDILPAIRHAVDTDCFDHLHFHLVRTDQRVRDDGEVFHKYAPLPVVMDKDKSTLKWFMYAAREEIDNALAASNLKPKKSFLGRLFN